MDAARQKAEATKAAEAIARNRRQMTETKPIRSRGRLLVEHQHLATSGARAALAFVA